MRIPLLFDGLWYDEVFTVQLAQLPLPQMIEALAGDVHPPLWYFLISVWPAPPRLLAMIVGLASLALAKSVLARLAPARPALTGLALMAISPLLIYYSVEIRMYSLLLFFVLLGARAALTGNSILLGLSIGLGLLTHNHMVLYMPGLIVVFMVDVSFSLREVSKMGLIALLVYAPWLPVAWNQLWAVSGHYWILPITPGRLVYLLVELIAGYTLTGLGLLIVAGLALVLLSVGLIRATQAGAHALVILMVGPVAAGVALSVAVAPVLIARVLIGAIPFMLLLIAWGGYDLYLVAGRWVAVAGIAATAISLFSLYSAASPVKIDYAAAYNALGVRDGEQCYHLSAGSYLMGRYYLPKCHHTTWAEAPRKANGLSDQTIAALGIERGEFSGRGWVFSTWEPYTPQLERDHLTAILAGRRAEQFIIMETDFVLDSVWRIDD